MGRPVKYTPELLEQISAEMQEYTANTEIPIFAEFCTIKKYSRQMLYSLPELTDTIKKMIDKKEAALERLALDGKINTTMAIFSLKQLGWKDRNENNIIVEGDLAKNMAKVLGKIPEG